MYLQKIFALVVLIPASIVPVLGQVSSPEAQACFDQRSDQPADLPNRMDACSRFIGAGGASTEERAQAHLRRAFAYAQRAGQSQSKDDIDRSAADLSEASRLVPSDPRVQRYVTETRASLQQLLTQAFRPGSPEGDKKGDETKEVERLREELRRTQEAMKVADQRLAALEALPAAPPPAQDTIKLARDLQTELKRVGCYPGASDGQWGKASQQALGKFVERTSLALPLEQPTSEALDSVTGQKGRICPLACASNKTESNGTCVAKQHNVKNQRRERWSGRQRVREPRTERREFNVPLGITIGRRRGGGVGINF